jgi:cob(I)alamin adenosyltransferase
MSKKNAGGGDKGITSLFNGERRQKSDPVFNAIGNIDELNSYIGFAIELIKETGDVPSELINIQGNLFLMGANLATPTYLSSMAKIEKTRFPESLLVQLEENIQKYDSQLPQLTNFILPSGGKIGSTLHICRSICRRAERSIVEIRMIHSIDDSVLKYINRLSDFLFVMARYYSKKYNYEETIWK